MSKYSVLRYITKTWADQASLDRVTRSILSALYTNYIGLIPKAGDNFIGHKMS